MNQFPQSLSTSLNRGSTVRKFIALVVITGESSGSRTVDGELLGPVMIRYGQE